MCWLVTFVTAEYVSLSFANFAFLCALCVNASDANRQVGFHV